MAESKKKTVGQLVLTESSALYLYERTYGGTTCSSHTLCDVRCTVQSSQDTRLNRAMAIRSNVTSYGACRWDSQGFGSKISGLVLNRFPSRASMVERWSVMN